MDARQLRSLFLNWVAADNLPFNLVESEVFRTFLNNVNPFADTLLPLSHNGQWTSADEQIYKEGFALLKIHQNQSHSPL